MVWFDVGYPFVECVMVDEELLEDVPTIHWV